ncbi:MAG: HEAT repeat domain-containing protein [Leptolyngbyaceae cyanobacterium]
MSQTAPPSDIANPSGEQLTLPQAIINLQGADLGLRVYAAWWLGRFRVQSTEACDLLIAALQDQADRTPAGGYPLRRNAARALGKLAYQKAVAPLVEALSCTDFYVREAAAQALEKLGNITAVSALLALLKNELPGTLPAPEPPQLVQPFDAIIEALGTLGATEAKAEIIPFLDHDIPRIQYAAARALYQLTDPSEAGQYGDRLIAALEGDDLQLRRAALSDIGAIGYFAAAKPIAETLAENSLKIIALKGLLEVQLNQSPLPQLSPEVNQIMTLIDGLL